MSWSAPCLLAAGWAARAASILRWRPQSGERLAPKFPPVGQLAEIIQLAHLASLRVRRFGRHALASLRRALPRAMAASKPPWQRFLDRVLACDFCTASLPSDPAWTAMRAALEKAGQSHVLTPPPPPEKAASFLAQLQAVDLANLSAMFEGSMKQAAAHGSAAIEPLADVTRLADLGGKRAASLRAEGLGLIADGRVAAVLLAGGQGTRLGSDAPKGCYDIGLPSRKSLFQYHAERIASVKALAAAHKGVAADAVRLRLYVMTSAATDAETRAFFEAVRGPRAQFVGAQFVGAQLRRAIRLTTPTRPPQHGCFGLPAADVRFFEQGTLPALSSDGKRCARRRASSCRRPTATAPCTWRCVTRARSRSSRRTASPASSNSRWTTRCATSPTPPSSASATARRPSARRSPCRSSTRTSPSACSRAAAAAPPSSSIRS